MKRNAETIRCAYGDRALDLVNRFSLRHTDKWQLKTHDSAWRTGNSGAKGPL